MQALLLLLLCLPQSPFEPEPVPVVPHIEGPAELRLGQKAKFTVVGLPAGVEPTWSVPASLDNDDGHEVTPTGLLIWPPVNGPYEIIAAAQHDNGKLVVMRMTTELKGARPPPAPTPVEPLVPPVDPPLVPPGPTDVTPATGLRVLFIYPPTATREQLTILNSGAVNAVLDEVCAKSGTGRAEWRKWDRDIDKRDQLKNETPAWRELWTAAKASLAKPDAATKLPCVFIQRGDAVSLFPLPATEAATIALLKAGGK